jgi:hypothetical protein
VTVSPCSIEIPAGRSVTFDLHADADASASTIAFEARTKDGAVATRREIALEITRTPRPAPTPTLVETGLVVASSTPTAAEPESALVAGARQYTVPAVTAAPAPPEARVESAPRPITNTPTVAAGARAPVPALTPAAAVSRGDAPRGSTTPWFALGFALLALVAGVGFVVRWREVATDVSEHELDGEPVLDTILDTVVDEDDLYVVLDSTDSLVWEA